MIVDLSKVEFVNDIFSTMLPSGNYLILNKIDESFLVEDTNEECTIKAINIELRDVEGNTEICPCVIGISNERIKISTNYIEYEGEVLTPDNMAYCTIEVYD